VHVVLFVIGKHAYNSGGRGGRIFCWENLAQEEFSMEREVSRG